ncbi:hypothetical protein [Bacillus sp. EAC]|uniref:hypothetical protein n=1 Tax=Bacillus sp. EAC TaxID=1978338 RepID=UPI000B44D6C9|nr:hypothetical protein [Bacillus sp. EAC]
MRVFLVFLLLFVLTVGLIIGIDYLEGASSQEIIGNFLGSKTELVGEDYVLIFLFTVPFGVAKFVLNYLENIKKKRNQQQDQGQNIAEQ